MALIREDGGGFKINSPLNIYEVYAETMLLPSLKEGQQSGTKEEKTANLA